MKIVSLALVLCFGLAGLVTAQDLGDIRAPDINAEAPDGALVTEAASAEDPADRVAPLEKLLADFPDSPYRGYAWLQLQGAYVQTQNFEKALEMGEKLLAVVPEDVEVRHNVNQSLVALQRWDDLLPALLESKPLAIKETTKPEPEYEDEVALWQGQIDYAKGVVQYVEWALNVGLGQQTDPQKRIQWMDTLAAEYPESQYVEGFDAKYALSHQQLGDIPKMLEYMQKAVDAGSNDPTFLYSLSENAMGTQENDKAKELAQRLVGSLETAAKPEGMSDEQWEAYKTKWSSYGNFVLGRLDVMLNTPNGFRAGRTKLLKTVKTFKAEGGQNYHMIAYFLGLCYVKLDIQGDNIKQASFWMGEAARTEGPFQAQAKETFAAIKDAQ